MISFIANRFNALNGADLMSRDILRGLLAAQSPLTVVSSDPPLTEAGFVECEPRIRWLAAPGPVSSPTSRWLGRPVSWMREYAARQYHGPSLERSSSQGMIVNGFSNHWIFRYVPRRPEKTPRVLIVHDSPGRFGLRDQPPLGWALRKMECYSHYVFCSQRVAGEWLETGALAGKQHCCIPNCCREEEVRRVRAQYRGAVRARLGLPARRFIVVCPATIQYRKGQDLLLDSFPVLAAAVPELLLCLVGAPLGEWGAWLVKRIQTSSLRDRMLALGPRRDALDFIHAADAVVLPSRSEAAPLTVLEAMALKTPVVAAAVGGVPELLEQGRSGLLFALENRYGLVEALTQLARDDIQRNTLSENAARRYWKHFSREHVVAGYATALRRLVAKESWTAAHASNEIVDGGK